VFPRRLNLAGVGVLRGQPHLEYLIPSALSRLVPQCALVLDSSLAWPLHAGDGRRSAGLLHRAAMCVGGLPPTAPLSHHLHQSLRIIE